MPQQRNSFQFIDFKKVCEMRKLFDTMISLEEESTKEIETEMIIYARVGDFDGLEKGTHKEHHLEYHAKIGKGKARIRKVDHFDGKIEHCFTLKVKQDQHNGLNVNNEHTLDVDDDFMEGFSHVADSKVDKTRYFFVSEKVELEVKGNDDVKSITLPKVIYEVDVFKKPDGTTSNWCKIEVEVDNILTFIDQNYPELKDIKLTIKVSHLPFKPLDSFVGKEEGSLDREKALWENEFKIDLTKQE